MLKPNPELEAALKKAEQTGDYVCVTCITLWKPHEVPEDMQDAEGCPDCLTYCERCGMLKCKGKNGHLEHCL